MTSTNAPPVALITGAAKRLGACTARALHNLGYDIVIHHHTSVDEAHALAGELNALRAASAVTLCHDLATVDAGTAIIKALLDVRARLDVLVNNASVFDRTPIASVDVAAWDRIHAINVRTPYFLSLAAAPLLRASHGAIVNITDIHSERPRAEYSAYCASKSGLVAVTRGLALELAPQVRVNAIAPGPILWAASEDAALQSATLAGTPLARRGDPQDIAEAVCYLVRAPFVTGHVLDVDGGRHLVL
ncbi:MAG: pteridine reductase [Gammaproteobacteria bacterium]|mgnify:FL=1|nr:pteridine reductase [Gammaproteobacteria bacterium]